MTEASGPPPLPPRGLTFEQTYQIISETVVGVNVWARANLLQAEMIAIFVALGVVGGWLGWGGEGAMVGLFLGLLGGVLVSGISVMIHRAIRHARGCHD